MNDAGQSVGPARGALQAELDHVLVLHDEIDLPFGEIRVRLGGGLAGHNGLKSIRAGPRLAGLRPRAGRRRAPADDRPRSGRRLRARPLPRARATRSPSSSKSAADAAERVVADGLEPERAGRGA